MKLFFGLLVFAFTMFLGISSAAIAAVAKQYLVVPEIEVSGFGPDDTGIAPEPRAIDIRYAGIRSEAQEIGTVYLILFIHNRTNEPLAYFGYSADHSFPLLKANGEKLPDTNYCRNGSREFTIPPGRSAKVLVAREEFPVDLPEGMPVSIGFRLRRPRANESTEYYSEPFRLPDGFLLQTSTR